MVTTADIRRIAISLPRTVERLVQDQVKFNIGRIVYLALSRDETTMGFAFPKEERAALVAGEPDKFHLPVPSNMRYKWVCATLAELELDELTELIVEAWTMCVPKRVAAEYLRDNG
jgi:hypothetical protein